MRVQQIFQLYLCAFIAVSTARLPVHNSHHEGKDATVSEISNGGVKLILNGIKESFPTLYNKQVEFVVLCLVPEEYPHTWTYKRLVGENLCVYKILDEDSRQYHPDQLAFDELKKTLFPNYSKKFGKHAFDIVFYDMMTPCRTCAERIVNDYRDIPNNVNVGELRIVYTRLYKYENANSLYHDPNGTENLKRVLGMIANFNENAYPRPLGRAIKINQENDL